MNMFDFGEPESKYPREVPTDMVPLVDKYLLTAPSDITYDIEGATYGSEFELADIDRSAKLPDGLTWDGKDQTVMNSNGVATDPSLDRNKRTWNYGGELNTKPCDTIDEIVLLYSELLSTTNATVNNSCNLHNHMRVPGLDLLGLKRLVAYYYIYRTEMIKYSDYIPTPSEQGFHEFNCTPEDYQLVVNRYKHHTNASKGTRHGDIEGYVTKFKLLAQSEEEFHASSCYTHEGEHKKSWAIASRGGLNTLQMRRSDKNEYSDISWDERPYAESGTFEFRMHHGTTDIEKYRNTLLWDTAIANAALNTGETPCEVYFKLFGDRPQSEVLPTYIPIDPKLYSIFKKTKNDGSEQRRATVRSRITMLKESGDI